MKVINDLRRKTGASDFVLALVIGLPEYYFKQLEDELASNVCQCIKDMLNEDKHNDIIAKVNNYNNEVMKFMDKYSDCGLLSIKEEIGVSYDDIMYDTLLTKKEVREALQKGYDGTENADKVVWSLMNRDISKCNTQEYNELVEESMNEPVCELDEAQESRIKRYEEDIHNLELQTDWYEQIIDSFNVLVRMISKK